MKLITSENLYEICHGDQRINAIKQLGNLSKETSQGTEVQRIKVLEKVHGKVGKPSFQINQRPYIFKLTLSRKNLFDREWKHTKGNYTLVFALHKKANTYKAKRN